MSSNSIDLNTLSSYQLFEFIKDVEQKDIEKLSYSNRRICQQALDILLRVDASICKSVEEKKEHSEQNGQVEGFSFQRIQVIKQSLTEKPTSTGIWKAFIFLCEKVSRIFETILNYANCSLSSKNILEKINLVKDKYKQSVISSSFVPSVSQINHQQAIPFSNEKNNSTHPQTTLSSSKDGNQETKFQNVPKQNEDAQVRKEKQWEAYLKDNLSISLCGISHLDNAQFYILVNLKKQDLSQFINHYVRDKDILLLEGIPFGKKVKNSSHLNLPKIEKDVVLSGWESKEILEQRPKRNELLNHMDKMSDTGKLFLPVLIIENCNRQMALINLLNEMAETDRYEDKRIFIILDDDVVLSEEQVAAFKDLISNVSMAIVFPKKKIKNTDVAIAMTTDYREKSIALPNQRTSMPSIKKEEISFPTVPSFDPTQTLPVTRSSSQIKMTTKKEKIALTS